MNDFTQIKALYQAMQSGNPMQMFQQMASNNPQLKPILKLLNSGSNPKDLFYETCQKRGINPDEFIKNITG